MTEEEILQVQALVALLYDESRTEDNMFSEAKAQWLESCLESPGDYDYVTLMGHLDGDAAHWAEQLYNDCGYEWLYKAVKQAEEEVWYITSDIEPPTEY